MVSRSFVDQLGAVVTLSARPSRIISLVPSQTELLYDLGLRSRVVGITRFCVHPTQWRKSKTIIGGTKNFSFETIDSLMPDLIIGNKEENYKEGIDRLRSHFPVWMSDIITKEDACNMIVAIGALTGRPKTAATIVANIQTSFRVIRKRSGLRVLYLIWRKPWMGAGAGTFIHNMLEEIGFSNCLENKPRYPQLTQDEISDLQPDVIFLSSEPYPFREKHISEIRKFAPGSGIVLVDGEMFSWYGSRMQYAPAYFNSLLI